MTYRHRLAGFAAILAAILAALAAAPAPGQDRILASARPPATACPAGGPLQVWLLQQSSATDCDNTVSGTVDALCCCINGAWAACVTSSGGSGTVTSVALAVPAEWSVSGSPVTTSGTITISEATQSANTVYAGPTSGGAAAPGFRAVVDADVPNTITVDLATAASDLTCTSCIGGTEIDESALGAVPTATALAANPADCSGSANDFAWRINASGDLACTSVDFSDAAPFGQYDPDNPPASMGTGGFNENWTGDTAAISWTWMNQDAATETIDHDSSLITGEATAEENRGRYAAAATNADQTLTAKLIAVPFPTTSTNSSCWIGEISAGTVASPTALEFLGYGDFATDNIGFYGDTNVDPTAGTTVHGSTVALWGIATFYLTDHYMQLRYIDSTRALTAWFSWDGISWFQIGSAVTIAADPLYWGFGARDTAICRFSWVHLRTDSDRNDTGE